MKENKIVVSNQEISYIDENENNDKTLLFLHGWGQSKQSFLPVINDLKNEGVRCISIDLPGHGNSEEPKEVFGVEDYANIINEIINILSLKNVIIIGHSFGCRISFYLALKNNNIHKLLLTGAAGIKPKRNLMYHVRVLGYKFQKFLCKTPFYSQYREDLLANSGSRDYKEATPRMKQVLIKVVNEDLTHLMPKIKQQVVLFWGINDMQTPLEDGVKMNNLISNSTLVKVDGSHYAFLENQELFVKEIKKLI